MEEFQVAVEVRTERGRSAASRARKNGKVPGVVYANHEEATAITVPLREFVALAKKATTSQLFTLKSSDKKLDNKIALVKEIQKDHLKGNILHVDFQTLREDVAIAVQVPLHIVGESPGIKNDGGLLNITTHELEVRSLPRKIPKYIEVDISTLLIGQNIHAKELKLPEGVELEGDPEITVVGVVEPKAIEIAAPTPAAEPAVAGAVPAEGEAAAGAEGAAPAAKEEGKEAAPEKGKGKAKE